MKGFYKKLKEYFFREVKKENTMMNRPSNPLQNIFLRLAGTIPGSKHISQWAPPRW
jgi:hypothetical protein